MPLGPLVMDRSHFKSYKEISKTEKPWGHEVIWANSAGSSDGYVAKLLFIKAGHKLSMQYHRDKEETIFVKSGILYIETFGRILDEKESLTSLRGKRKLIKLAPGGVFHISPFFTHRFIANETHVELIEVSTKHLTDVVRIEDEYGRV
jgi:mannose-6-phosphate isomerase